MNRVNDRPIINSWYYDPYDNMLIDQEGRPVIDIFRVMSPSRLLWCKQKRGTFYFKSQTEVDVTYEVVFPREGEEEDGYYDFIERTY